MEEETTNGLKNYVIFAPVISASLVNAMYSLELLKLQRGESIDRKKIIDQVVHSWTDVSLLIQRAYRQKPSTE